MSIDPTELERRIGTEFYTKYSSFMPVTDINEIEFATLVVQVVKVEANSNVASSTAPRASSLISTIKIWAVSPLNPLDSSFAKALENERTFKETSEIRSFHLERETWIIFRNHSSTKSDRCCLEKISTFPLTAGGPPLPLT